MGGTPDGQTTGTGIFANPLARTTVVFLAAAKLLAFPSVTIPSPLGPVIVSGLPGIWRSAMIALGIAAVIPVRVGDLRSHPHPIRDYANAVSRARALVASDDSVVSEGGATILRVHAGRTPRVVVLFHGFTNSPRQFAELADSLFASGDNVLVPRLPHHALRGKDVHELKYLRADELCRTADEAVDIAAGLGDSVVVLGLSVGGTMATWTGEHRAEVRRAVAIAPPFEVTHVPSMLERPLVNIGGHVPNVSRRAAPDSERPDREPGIATHGLAQVLKLGMSVRRDAERVGTTSAELLFLVNASDHTVKTAPVLDVARAWNNHGAPVSVYELPDSLALPHNVLDPMGREVTPATVLPVLVALAHGDHPPAWVRARR
jgi:esterase/lipase